MNSMSCGRSMPGLKISIWPYPPGPLASGSATPRANETAIAASTTLPPARSTLRPASVATGLALEIAARPMADGSRPAPGGWNRLVIEVDDLDSELEGLRAADVRIRGHVVSGPGGKQVVLEDSAGNPVELFQAATK